ncbi:MAG: alpha/beta hydrolase [Actinomycetales bacterium]|nr:alpha/beta hydrolase [Actinomycetales bacterium]
MPTEVRLVQGVAVHSAGQGLGIVLLHANGGDHRDFAAVIPELARTSRVHAIDWPGHGQSQPMDDATALGFADLLPGVLEALGPGPFALVGNSVGGFAALRTAIARPDLVNRLVLVNPGGFTPRTPVSVAACRFIGSPGLAPMAMRRLPRLYLRRRTPQVRAAQERAVEASRSGLQARAFASLWRSFADPGHDARRGIEALTVPTLLIWGTRDPVLPWAVDGRRAARALSGSRVVTLPCGHQAFLETPAEFLREVRAFLDEPSGPSG